MHSGWSDVEAEVRRLIQLRVKKRFGEFLLDAEISDERFICLSGKNGSGKSTLLRIIAGQLQADEGILRLDSKDITKLLPEKRGIVLVTPDSCIPHMEVRKHLLWGANVRKIAVSGEYIANVKRNLGITYDGIVAKLSLGMKERVSLATALITKPDVILIDEAFANIDNRREFMNSFKALANESGIDTIFSTQDSEDSTLADHQYILDNGKSNRKF